MTQATAAQARVTSWTRRQAGLVAEAARDAGDAAVLAAADRVRGGFWIARADAAEAAQDAPTRPPEAAADAPMPPEAARGGPRAGTPRTGTKRAAVLALLRRPKGASGPRIAEATGWAPHTVRGFLAGLKKRGTEVVVHERVRQVGPGKEGARGSFTVYRVAAEPTG